MIIGSRDYSYADLSEMIHKRGETKKESFQVTLRRIAQLPHAKTYLNEKKILSLVSQKPNTSVREQASIEAALLFNQARLSKKLQKKIECTLYNQIGQHLFRKGPSSPALSNRSIPTRNSSASSILFKSSSTRLSFALSGNPSYLEANSPIMMALLSRSKEFNHLDLELQEIEVFESNSEDQRLNRLCTHVYEAFIQLLKDELKVIDNQTIAQTSSLFIKKSLLEQLSAIEQELVLALIGESQKGCHVSDLSGIRAVLQGSFSPQWLTEQLLLKLKRTLQFSPLEYLSEQEDASIRRLLRAIAWYIEQDKSSLKTEQLSSRLTVREKEIIHKLKAHSLKYSVRDWKTYEESLNLMQLFPETKVGSLRDYSKSVENELYQLYEKLF